MKNTFGSSIQLTISGESHGEAIVVTLDGVRAGVRIDREFIEKKLSLRRPSGSISTSRSEADEFKILSGIFEDCTTGTPICMLIPNTSKKSADYESTRYIPRPSHADLSAYMKYGGYQDHRGGGHFSGRITAGIVAAGAIAELVLREDGIRIGTHIKSIGKTCDREFSILNEDIEYLSDKSFPVLDTVKGEDMVKTIEEARESLDSVGGSLETAVIGMGGGYGEPWFDTVESVLAHIIFSIPAVKAVSFGIGERFAEMKGSEANDNLITENGVTVTETNNNGGINGGITNGMPIIFSVTVKPTPSIASEQRSVDIRSGEEVALSIRGRHDPCIVHRAAHVVNACTAIALLDMITTRDGNAVRNRKI